MTERDHYFVADVLFTPFDGCFEEEPPTDGPHYSVELRTYGGAAITVFDKAPWGVWTSRDPEYGETHEPVSESFADALVACCYPVEASEAEIVDAVEALPEYEAAFIDELLGLYRSEQLDATREADSLVRWALRHSDFEVQRSEIQESDTEEGTNVSESDTEAVSN